MYMESILGSCASVFRACSVSPSVENMKSIIYAFERRIKRRTYMEYFGYVLSHCHSLICQLFRVDYIDFVPLLTFMPIGH